MQCCYLDYGLLQSSSDVIAAGGYCPRFIMRPDVCPSTDSKRRPYRFEIFSFQNYLDISNIDGSVLNCSIAVANALETPQSLTKPSICVPRKCWKGPVSLITKHIYCQKLYLTNDGKLFKILFQNLSEIDKEVGSPRWLDFTKAHGLFSAIL